jgi:hypothetical protein
MHRQLELLIERQMGISARGVGSQRIYVADGWDSNERGEGGSCRYGIARPGRPGEIVVPGAPSDNVTWM